MTTPRALNKRRIRCKFDRDLIRHGIRIACYLDERSEDRAIARIMRALPARTRAVELRERKRSDVRIVIHHSTYPDYAGQVQVSRFDAYGPSGHWNAATFADAIASLMGKRVPAIGIPYGSATQFYLARAL